MLKTYLFAALALCGSSSASSQMFKTEILEACYDPTIVEVPQGKQVRYADAAFQRYVDNARGSQSLARAFSKSGYAGKRVREPTWAFDGAETTPDKAIDPWINRAAAFKNLGMVRSRTDINVWAQWQALSSDGTVLGTYDAFLVAHLGGYRIRWLKLYSSGSPRQAEPLGPFCSYPGDIRDHQQNPKEEL